MLRFSQRQISDGKATHTISIKRLAKQLENNATKCDLLAEFVKADKSKWLEISEEGKAVELEKVRSIFESNGTDVSTLKRWDMKRTDMATVTIIFCLTRARDNDEGDNLVNFDEL